MAAKKKRPKAKKPAQNSGRTAGKKPHNPGRPFQPGQSGNPGGRPKILAEVREAARDHTTDAIKVFVGCLEDTNPYVRMAAANFLLDRGWGKPTQTIDGSQNLTHEQWLAKLK